jgi:hypothetical protein
MRGPWTIVRAFAAAVSLLLCGAAGAVPIATWDIANATGQTASVGFTEAGVTAADLVGVGVNPWGSTAQDGFVVASGWAPGPAPDPSLYFEWSFTLDASTSVQLSSIELALLRGIQGGNHGAELWDLHASTDAFGGGSDVFLATLDISSSGVDEQIVFNVDLSVLGTVTNTTVTFRLYGYDYTSAADFSGLGNDSGWVISGTGADLTVDGILVPEPRSAILLATGLVLLGSFARLLQSSAKRSR